MLVSVKAGECPTPQQGITTWRCESDGECEGALKCCREDQGQLCRHPLYVTRFQVDVTLNAPWKNIYNNLDSVLMMNLRDRLHDHFADLKSFMGLTLLLAASGSVKVSVEVVASPEVSREDVQQTVTSLRGKQVRFDNVVRLVSSASLVTHEFCGSQDCGGGSCVSTTRGAKCLCSQGLYGDRCQFSNICMAGLCQNGGTCVGTGTIRETGVDYQFSCLCGPGFMGDTCEVSVCDQLPTELCNRGTCLGDLTGGALCSCPLDRRGIFCQDNGTEMPYTECELRKRLNNYIADVLKGKTTIAGMNMNGVKNLLLSLGVEWLPLLTCQHGGAYTLTVEVLSVTDRSTTRHICLDRHGEEEVDCQSKVCSTLGTICQNNGTCVGNINLQLCHCAGTGHHGAVCDKPGEGEPTDCQQRHDLAQLTLDALSGNLEVKGMTGQTAKTTITSLLSDIHRDKFWQPDCTKGGSHAYRGCEFGVPDITSKTCFCVDDMNERLEGTPTSSSGLPECPVAGACSEFSSEPCGAHGKCVGDLNAGALCECDQDYSGTMCQVNSPDTLTDCQRRGRLTNYLLSIMSGYGQPPPELSGTVQQLLSRAGMTRLEVPTCGGDGFYRYTCTYTVDSLVLDGCRCTNDDGTYTGDEASCDVLEKPGECPLTEPATPGVPQMECESDNRCNDSQKCCPVGSGRQCLDPVLVSTFQVNVTVNAPYSQFSSARADLLTQLGDVFGTLPGFIAVTIVQATQGSIKLTVKVKAAMDVTAADIDNTLNRLRAAQFTLTSSTLYDVTSVVFVAGGACEDVQCGLGVCVDTSFGARCVCPVGTSGNMCQYSMLPCNCSAGQQCVRGTHQDTLACSCYPQNDATCRMPLWFCDGKADCRVSEKCVHMEDCDVVKNGDCDVKSRCIPLSESEACDSQPCQHGALCVTKNDGSYRCQCQQGFSGSHCEENVGVCNVVPDKVCTLGCVGDAHVGVLCQCPHGRGGINCDQPAHSPCEQQHALFSDMLNISKSSLSVPGVTQTQLYNMMTQIMTHIDAQDLPLTNCTSDGGFSPVQCKVNLRSQAETCHCVNQDGTPISSNVLAYPGFPACTGGCFPVSISLGGVLWWVLSCLNIFRWCFVVGAFLSQYL
ncbi:hypothetical protein V1264_006027 [Littorina saxatilis]|uniref:Uncharacterized protein n=1 Tax=Littorina saxatilis TaxID=31220 RepID=A0AAN9AW32_9CAEN